MKLPISKILIAATLLATLSTACGNQDDESPTASVAGKTVPACYDNHHHRVNVQTTQSEEGGPAFSTTSPSGQPIIVFNQSFMQAIAHSMAMVMFVYEHECGHHALGHIQPGKSPHAESQKDHFKQELDADCYAAQRLRSRGYTSSSILAIIDDIYPWPKDSEHPSGKVRSRHVAACFKAAGESPSN